MNKEIDLSKGFGSGDASLDYGHREPCREGDVFNLFTSIVPVLPREAITEGNRNGDIETNEKILAKGEGNLKNAGVVMLGVFMDPGYEFKAPVAEGEGN